MTQANKSSATNRKVLTIITGKNLSPPVSSADATASIIANTIGKSGIPSGDVSNAATAPRTEDESYRLSDEIQRVLIEDFFPPISSSTVPGNPGRLYIVI